MNPESSPECSVAPAIAASLLAVALAFAAIPGMAVPFTFSTGSPDGKIATASRPDGSGGIFEIESADDFVLTTQTSITHATFTGLLVSPTGTLPSVGDVVVEIYRVFPKDSDVTRTSGPAIFSTSQVPTRVNSPSDVAFAAPGAPIPTDLSFTTSVLSTSFTAANSIRAGGIHAAPDQTTGGNGAVTGEEVLFDITFTDPLLLPADHYFLVPQVAVTGGDFYWLSAPKPIVPPGTPFPPGFTDLQSWTRDANLDPDWLRVGTDIVGPSTTGGPAPTFNAAFSLDGATVPEPATLALLGIAFAAIGLSRLRKVI